MTFGTLACEGVPDGWYKIKKMTFGTLVCEGVPDGGGESMIVNFIRVANNTAFTHFIPHHNVTVFAESYQIDDGYYLVDKCTNPLPPHRNPTGKKTRPKNRHS